MSLWLQGIKHNPFAWQARPLKTCGLAFIPASSLPSQAAPAVTKFTSPEHVLLSKTTKPSCSGTPLILTSSGTNILCFLVCTLASKCCLRGGASTSFFSSLRAFTGSFGRDVSALSIPLSKLLLYHTAIFKTSFIGVQLICNIVLVSGVWQSGSVIPVDVWLLSYILLFHDFMVCSSPASSVHGTFQARMLEWIAISFSRGFSQPRDGTRVSCIADRFFTTEPPGKSIHIDPLF